MVKLRLFELYTEKHRLLDKKEKTLEIFGSKNSLQKIKKYKKVKRSVLKKIEKLTNKISNYIKDRKILTKLYYFKALSYDIEKKENLFYKNMKKAEGYVENKKYERQIYIRLAEYHYNKKQYSSAQKYYEKLITLPSDVWLKKNLFNLAWVYLKTEKVSKAILTLNSVYTLPKNKKYHELGVQLDRTLILFYAISTKIESGLKFLKTQNMNSFENLLLLLRYNSENGDKNKTTLILDELDKIKKTITQKAILLIKSIELLRADRKYPQIQRIIINFNKHKLAFQNIEKAEIKKLVLDLKSYTGFLQIYLKSKEIAAKKRRVIILKYILFNFELLSHLDANQSIEYNYLKGESSLVMKRYKLAFSFYKRSIIIYSKMKNENIKRIAPVYESLYFCLERIDKDKSYLANLLWGYKSYLKFQPRGKLSDIIYQNYINLNFNQKNMHQIPKIIKTYNKYYPKKLTLQKKFYQKLVGTHVKEKELKHLTNLRKILKQGFLGYGLKEVKNISLIINELYFKQYDDLYKQGDYKGALKGFKSIVMNKKHDYDLKIDSLINILKINHDHKLYDSLSANLGVFFKFAKKNILKKNLEKIRYYVSLFCNKNIDKACFKHTLFLNKSFKEALDNFLVEKLFKLSLFNSKYNYALKLLKKYPQHEPFFIQSLLLTDQVKMLKIIKNIKSQKIIKELTPILTHIAWTQAFASKDLSELIKFKTRATGVRVMEPIIKNIFKQFKYLKQQLKPIPLLRVPRPLTFEGFSKYLKDLLVENHKMNSKIDYMMKDSNPYLTFFILSHIVRYYKNLVNYTQKFSANTSDENLNLAIENEIRKISLLYFNKITDFSNLKNQLMNKVNDKAGSAKLYHDKSHGTFQIKPFQRSLLWK
jgi:hypothetical protein